MANKEETKVEKSFEYKGRKCVILWVGSHFCTYIETKLKDVSYSQEFGSYETSPSSCVECHGGITFGAGKITPTPFDEDIQYFGCDYAHCGDYLSYYDEGNYEHHRKDHRWTLGEVEKEAKEFCDSLLKYEELYDKYKKLFDEFQKKLKEINDAEVSGGEK